MIESSVEAMDSEELNEWVVNAMMSMTGDDRRGVVTMSVMISMFQAFIESNPEIDDAFAQYMDDEVIEETLH